MLDSAVEMRFDSEFAFEFEFEFEFNSNAFAARFEVALHSLLLAA
jgi:hypothetical protein